MAQNALEMEQKDNHALATALVIAQIFKKVLLCQIVLISPVSLETKCRFADNYIMVVGDGKGVQFLAPNSSDPLPACLTGTKNRVTPNGARRNPSMMKTHGGYFSTPDNTNIMLKFIFLSF